MTVSRVAVLALVLVPMSGSEASAQNQNPGEHLVLTRIAEGFARTNPDGTPVVNGVHGAERDGDVPFRLGLFTDW